MHCGRQTAAGWLAAALLGVACRGAVAGDARPQETMRVALAERAAAAPGGEVLREIDDPATGDRWLLVRAPGLPAGPGRLVLAGHAVRSHAVQLQAVREGRVALPQRAAVKRPVIEPGDLLLIEEHTPVIDTRLEATALGSANEGAYFKARLKAGGTVVRVEAVSHGHAVFGAGSEVGP